LPNGHQYITKYKEGQVQLVFPNGQVFSSESYKQDVQPAFVNEDETLVAVTRVPERPSGELHIYIKESKGKYRELPNVMKQVSELYDDLGGGMFRLQGIAGRTLTVFAVDRRVGKGSAYYRMVINLQVAPDGKLSLVE